MKLLKSPMFYILGLVVVMIVVGYHLKHKTVEEQEGNIIREVKKQFPNHPYDLYGACSVGQGRYFVVGSNGVILRSKDMGKTWNECSLDQPGKNLISVCFTSEDTGWVVGTSGLAYETVDAGQNWSRVKLRIGDTCLKRVYFFNDKQGWIVGEGPVIFCTSDSGKTWQERNIENEMLILNDIGFFNANVGITIGETGAVFYTEDGGNTWTRQESATDQALMRICIVNENEAWICGLNGVLFRTEDRGKTWKSVTVTNGETLIQDHIFNCKWIPAVGTGNDLIFLIGDGLIARSFDLGMSWRHTQQVTNNESDVSYLWFYDMVFDENSGGIIVGKNGFIAFSEDAERWERIH
ncbi:hypothetical protein PITCH_A30002 [uncultured Desulfobacterium sp.]|uniref:Photosynthesis system II assembly factor Ycf48/Hcf136-like domain-containing protein n=1 Tax=uncultured Desulfobacterium sp. TaxID=201089 RepID=A0A445MZ88_9BACT|nr:hypothetical protein PITCH_A30002 [uncultured Desulfobacterium sp.]